jgi:hypothetical protein
MEAWWTKLGERKQIIILLFLTVLGGGYLMCRIGGVLDEEERFVERPLEIASQVGAFLDRNFDIMDDDKDGDLTEEEVALFETKPGCLQERDACVRLRSQFREIGHYGVNRRDLASYAARVKLPR